MVRSFYPQSLVEKRVKESSGHYFKIVGLILQPNELVSPIWLMLVDGRDGVFRPVLMQKFGFSPFFYFRLVLYRSSLSPAI